MRRGAQGPLPAKICVSYGSGEQVGACDTKCERKPMLADVERRQADAVFSADLRDKCVVDAPGKVELVRPGKNSGYGRG